MSHRPAVAAAALAATFLFGASHPAHAQVVITRVAPPPPVYEVTPQARPGQVWAPGHHEWRNNQYVWVPGQWLQERRGQEYRARRWEERDGEWRLVGGDWARRGPGGDRDGDGIANRNDRDRDGDGIRNRDDPRPNQAANQRGRNRFGPNGDLDGDGIRNAQDRDRDGDGIRNNRDRFPDDRRRN